MRVKYGLTSLTFAGAVSLERRKYGKLYHHHPLRFSWLTGKFVQTIAAFCNFFLLAQPGAVASNGKNEDSYLFAQQICYDKYMR
jgi:hypothetical protein